MRVLSQFTTVNDEQTGAVIVGRLLVDDEGIVRFQARDVEDRPEEAAAAPQGSRPADEEVGVPEQ